MGYLVHVLILWRDNWCWSLLELLKGLPLMHAAYFVQVMHILCLILKYQYTLII